MGAKPSTLKPGLFKTSVADRANARLAGKYSKADKKAKAKWDQATSWKRILELNRAYLRDEIEFTPYYAGPIHDETLPLVPGLLELHDYGFLPYSSQPARIDGPRETSCPCCDKREVFIAQQKPFLSLLVPGNGDTIDGQKVVDFTNALIQNDGFHACVLAFHRFCKSDGCVMKPAVMSSFPGDWETHLEKRAKAVEEFEGMEWKKKRFIEPDCTCIMRKFNNAFEVGQETCPIIIHVLAKSFDDEDLAGHVKRVAEQAGLERAFAEDTQ